jgi:tRNA uridine 5-carboxymethylaminomethyl modification enzyme
MRTLFSRPTLAVAQVASLEELLRRPHVRYKVLLDAGQGDPNLTDIERDCVEIDIKYKGFLRRQEQQLKQMQSKHHRPIPGDLDYSNVPSLSSEAQEKLSKMRPANIGQAVRIGGVNPADISALLIYMEASRRRRALEMEEEGSRVAAVV